MHNLLLAGGMEQCDLKIDSSDNFNVCRHTRYLYDR